MQDGIDVYVGIDVGKYSHHVAAITKDQELVYDKKINNTQEEIEDLFRVLSDTFTCSIVVDQPGNLSSLIFAIADSLNIEHGFITPHAMHQAASLYDSNMKTDRIDAFIIADVSMRIPSLVTTCKGVSDSMKTLSALVSHDLTLAKDITRVINRLHDLLLMIHPALERALSASKLHSQVVLHLLRGFGGPMGLRDAGQREVEKWVLEQTGIGASSLKDVERVFKALDDQSAHLISSPEIEKMIAIEAESILAMKQQRSLVERQRQRCLLQIPEAVLLSTLPGVGPITCSTFIAETGGIDNFDKPGQLARYAGYAPCIKRSGKSVNSSSKPKGGNQKLKRVLFLSARCSIRLCDESKDYYERKLREGKCHNAAVTALARKRIDVMFAMLKNGMPYMPPCNR